MTPIHDFLCKYGSSDYERCHMPGHKGGANDGIQSAKTGNPHDITEIDGAVEIIKQSEGVAAGLFGAKRSLFSCSGSTPAISAMLAFCANKRVTAFRGAHRSLIDAAILLDFGIDWVYSGVLPENCVSPETAAVFATSIDYYGNGLDIREIAQTCEKLSLPLLVDNAHGAYLVFTDEHPLRLGAAMSADSAHKTLPALTGAAYLHISDEKYIKQAESGFDLFGTSSPSYLILESLDLCNVHIADERERAQSAFKAVAELKKALIASGYRLRETDLLRIVVDVNAYGYFGDDYANELRNHGIICEMYDSQQVILLFSTVTQEKNTLRVLEAMRLIPQKQPLTDCQLSIVNRQPSTVMPPRAAYFSPKRTVLLHEAVGEVCAGVHVTFPPCVPLVVPGEMITQEAVQILTRSGLRKIDVILR